MTESHDKRPIHLLDAKGMHKKFPYTFYVPSEALLETISPGCLVKAIFCRASVTATGQEDREWMWINVANIDGSKIIGTLDNIPEIDFGIQLHDQVQLELRHVVRIDSEACLKELADFEVWSKSRKCYISKEVMINKRSILYIEHVDLSSKDKAASMWVFESGDEAGAFSFDNYISGSLGAALNIDDSFKEFLVSKPGTAFRRECADSKFEATNAVLSSAFRE